MKLKHIAIATTIAAVTGLLTAPGAQAQYKGGANDGNAAATVVIVNILPNIYKGGNNDGAAKAQVGGRNAIPNIYKGGSNDGVAAMSVYALNVQPNIYVGGNNDGTAMAASNNNNPLANIYAGGNDDGFAVVISFNDNNAFNIYTGGYGDGFAIAGTTWSNPLTNIYSGGNNDGSAAIMIKGQNPMALFVPASGKLTQGDNTRYTVYPNPGNGIFNISLHGVADISAYSYRVMAGDGKLLREASLHTAVTQFNISGNASGIYYVQLLKANQLIKTYKIILQQ